MLWLVLAAAFYGQHLQDEYVENNFFLEKTDGVFVDIGANDGISFSNTYYFEKEKGWKGLCIEPIPTIFEQLHKNRKAICIQGCITPQEGKAKFTHVKGSSEMLSGLSEKYHPSHQERIENEIQRQRESKEEIEVQCFRLNDLLEKNNFFHVDYLSIDTEGGELEILKSIDFDKFDIDIIDVENNYEDPAFNKFLSSKGYVLIKHLNVDEIYKKKDMNLSRLNVSQLLISSVSSCPKIL